MHGRKNAMRTSIKMKPGAAWLKKTHLFGPCLHSSMSPEQSPPLKPSGHDAHPDVRLHSAPPHVHVILQSSPQRFSSQAVIRINEVRIAQS